MVARRDRSISYLAEEIIEQVLLRVQCIKSIVRCLSVNRSWYVLIKSRHHFINAHLHSRKYLLCHEKSLQEDYYQSICYDDNEAFQEYRRLEYPNKPLHVDGCNGLICYNTISDPARLYLWNPSIKKVKLVPASPALNHFGTNIFGLWFDSKTNDYEILRIIPAVQTTTVELYSLNKNSWKLISDNAPVTPTCNPPSQLECVNGVWYWLVLNNNNMWLLTSLDTKTWMFREEVKPMWRSVHLYLRPVHVHDLLVIIGYGHLDNFINFGLDAHLPCRCTLALTYKGSSGDFMGLTSQPKRFDYTMSPGVRSNGEWLLQNIRPRHKMEIQSCSFETRGKISTFITRVLLKVIPFSETLDLLNDATTD